MTTAVISFILSGVALGSLVYAYSQFDETPLVGQVLSNWSLRPIYNITAVPADQPCPLNFEPMLATEWPGTQDICVCYPDTGALETSAGACSDDADNCQTSYGVPPIPMEILFQKRYCVQRATRNVNFTSFPSPDPDTNACPQDTHLCGSSLCWPNDIVCPIN